MLEFAKLEPIEDLRGFIKEHFDVDLPVRGGWGYDAATPVEIVDDTKLPKKQLQHIFATIRANIEMHLMQEKGKGYSGINVKEIGRTQEEDCEAVEYEITALPEKLYEKFINEYKAGYGKEDFDMEEHFRRRKEHTVSRKVKIYFK